MEENHRPKDLRVFLKFKNARLLDAIALKFGEEYPIYKAAEQMGVGFVYLSSLLNLRASPFTSAPGERKGAHSGVYFEGHYFSHRAMRVADALKCAPTDIFSPSLYQLRIPKKIFRDMDSVQMLSLQEARSQGLLTCESYEQDFEAFSLRDDVENVLKTLTPREEKIIRARFGIGEPAKTYEEVGGNIGVGRERIRQIEMKAIRKMRHPERSRILKPYFKEKEGSE
jgi:RNA polymerase sigma factor (sigma-70 family)